MQDWWSELFTAAGWAQTRRCWVQGLTQDDQLCTVDFAMGTLADPGLARLLQAEHVDLDRLESALLHVPPRVVDPEALADGAAEVAGHRDDSEVSADHVFSWLLRFPEVAEAAWVVGVYPIGHGWHVGGLGALAKGVARAARPFIGRVELEAIVIDDHEEVTRELVFDLLVEDAMLSPVAALRGIRTIEADGSATVFLGTPAQVASRWPAITARVRADGSRLRVRRERRTGER